jgi:hypothetical protein
MFRPFSGKHSTKKNTLMTSYKIRCTIMQLKYRILKWLKMAVLTLPDVFSHCGELKMFICSQKCYIFMTWKNPGHLAS